MQKNGLKDWSWESGNESSEGEITLVTMWKKRRGESRRKDRGEGVQVRADQGRETECAKAGWSPGPRARRGEEIDGAIFAKQHFQTRS